MSQKSGYLIVSNGFFVENVGHTLTKNCNGTCWPLFVSTITFPLLFISIASFACFFVVLDTLSLK